MKHFLTGLTISLTLCAAAAAQSAGSSVSPVMQEIAQQELEANPHPKLVNPGGGTVAAPILRKTLQRLLPEIGITPQADTQSRK